MNGPISQRSWGTSHGTGAPRQRHGQGARPSPDPILPGTDRHTGTPARARPEDGEEMTLALLHLRPADRPRAAEEHRPGGAEGGGRGSHPGADATALRALQRHVGRHSTLVSQQTAPSSSAGACLRSSQEPERWPAGHRWTNGQVERMNRTIKDATVKRYHYDSHGQLRAPLQLFVDAYIHARCLKTLRGLTPYEFICQAWVKSLTGSGSTRHTTSRDRTPSSQTGTAARIWTTARPRRLSPPDRHGGAVGSAGRA